MNRENPNNSILRRELLDTYGRLLPGVDLTEAERNGIAEWVRNSLSDDMNRMTTAAIAGQANEIERIVSIDNMRRDTQPRFAITNVTKDKIVLTFNFTPESESLIQDFQRVLRNRAEVQYNGMVGTLIIYHGQRIETEERRTPVLHFNAPEEFIDKISNTMNEIANCGAYVAPEDKREEIINIMAKNFGLKIHFER